MKNNEKTSIAITRMSNKKIKIMMVLDKRTGGAFVDNLIDEAYHKMWQKGDVKVSPKDFKGGGE